MSEVVDPPHPSGALRVEALSAVFQVRPHDSDDTLELCVLLRRHESAAGSQWALPGGDVGAEETLRASIRRWLAEQTDVTDAPHLEQLAVFSQPDRVPEIRTIAVTYLALVPADAADETGPLAQWWPVDTLPELVADHGDILELARQRLAARLSYTNIAFALAPKRFPMSELSEIYCAALGYPVDSTNLLRVLSRRGVVVATGTVGKTGRTGGRPPALYAFADDELRVTDEFATLRPPP